MMKTTLAFAVALLALSVLPASATHQTRHWVYNASNTCAWMTLDVSSAIRGWKNVGFRYVKPGEQTDWTIDATTQLKIRAEPTKNADCSGGKIADLSVQETNVMARLGSSETTLYRHANGTFGLKWGKP